jgi:hypothetical protein
MQTAKIWTSIEALKNEAEAALEENTPLLVIIKSAPTPASVSETQPETSNLSVLKCNPTPPLAKLSNKHENSGISLEAPLPSATMAEIASAIDRAGKISKAATLDQSIGGITDDFRQDLLTEVEKAVRAVLSAELPQLVRYAVSVSMHELLTTSTKPKPQKARAREVKQVDGTSPKKLKRPKVAKKRNIL